MAELDYDNFDWDKGNATKNLAKHGVSRETIEAFFRNKPILAEDPKHSETEKRQLAVGRSEDGRWMVVSYTIRIKDGHQFVRPISARYMHAKEVSDYEKG
jgi:uncharacterized protein